jgi:shikimate dehydrogenase
MSAAIGGTTRVAGVIGWPVSHSQSPVLHNAWLQAASIDAVYLPFPVKPDGLAAFIAGMRTTGCIGLNVTLPHKIAVLDFVDTLTPTARAVGAVNTVTFGPNQVEGHNTDADGYIVSVRQSVPEWQSRAAPSVVLGAGGAARAVAVGLRDAGAPAVRILNRTRARADALVSSIDGALSAHDWATPAAALADAGLIVNTTSLGMTGQPSLELDLTGLPPSAVVSDIIYDPEETELLRWGHTHGHATVSGRPMLIEQARLSFARWFGITPIGPG